MQCPDVDVACARLDIESGDADTCHPHHPFATRFSSAASHPQGAWLLKARDKRVVRRNGAGAEIVAPKQEDRPAQALVTEEQEAPVVVEGSNESSLTIFTDDAEEEDEDDDEPADAVAPALAEAVAQSS